MGLEVVIDKSFDANALSKYHLSLKIGQDSFIANATKIKSGSNIGVTHQSFKGEYKQEFPTSAFIETLKKSPIKISKKYHSVSISISNTYFAIVPKALFDIQSLSAYVELNSKISDDYVYKHQLIPNSSIVLCFAIPKELNDWISNVFPKAKIIHELGISIETALRDYKTLSENRLILNVHKTHFDFIYLKEGKLDFVNSFQFQEKEDFLYFLLFACEQLQVNPHEIQTFLLGDIKKGGELHQLLFQYIKHIDFGNRNKNIKISPGLNGIPNHYYYNTFNQYLCG